MNDMITMDEAGQQLLTHPPLFTNKPVLPEPRPKGPNDCPMCGYPKGQPGFMQAFVPISHRLFGKLIRCPLCWDGHLPQYLRKLSGLSDKMLAWSLDAMMSDPGRRKARTAAKAFCGRPTGWLTVWGSYGVGKTYVLASVVNEMRRQEKAAMYVVAPDLLDALRDSYNPDNPEAFNPFFEKVKNIPILALDELGQVRMTPWATEKIFQLLDYRLREAVRLGTVIALHFEPKPSNAPADWPNRAQALLSRMYEDKDRVIGISGGDVRPLMG